MPEIAQRIELLQASVDEDDESHFRFLCHGTHVKYVTIAPGLYAEDDMCFAPALIPLLPPFPSGDWNYGYIARNPERSIPYFECVAKRQLPGIKSVWHSTRLDHLSFTYGDKLRSGVYVATSPVFLCPVVVKFARFDWEIEYLEKESAAYQWIDGQDIGPEFLGHLLEEGRVIGFMMEYITSARHATPNDLAICQEKLSSLHRLGILHGDTNKFNFLVRDRRVTLLDFDFAKKCDDVAELEEELHSLRGQFDDTSGRGGSTRVDD